MPGRLGGRGKFVFDDGRLPEIPEGRAKFGFMPPGKLLFGRLLNVLGGRGIFTPALEGLLDIPGGRGRFTFVDGKSPDIPDD